MVAPYTGAWIEIVYRLGLGNGLNVAPYTGAWIEIQSEWGYLSRGKVAPYTGAWIEMEGNAVDTLFVRSRTLHGCVD